MVSNRLPKIVCLKEYIQQTPFSNVMITSFNTEFLILSKPQFPQQKNKENKFYPLNGAIRIIGDNPTKTLGIIKWQIFSIQ